MLSYWERQSFLKYDFIVIGGGIVGLSTAITLKETHPTANVLVLERGLFSSGASTKNAGFACFGSLTELIFDQQTYGHDATLQTVEMRWKGLLGLRKRLGDNNIGYEASGGWELFFDQNDPRLYQLDELNRQLKPIIGQTVYERADDKIQVCGFNSRLVKAMVWNKGEGTINTGLMMRNLERYAYQVGVTFITGAAVKTLVTNENTVDIQVSWQDIMFQGKYVAVCTNAFTKMLLSDLDLTPGRGQVLITKPLPKGVPFKGSYHFDEGYFYFRDLDNRVLFGGGRNHFIDEETTTDLEVNPKVIALLEHQLKSLILPNTPFEVEMTWSGIMAFGPQRQPIIKAITPRVFAGVRMGGMGVAIGTEVGYRLTEMMTGTVKRP